jgi:CBS domain-containing protein
MMKVTRGKSGVYAVRVRDIMSKQVVTVYPDDPLHEAFKLLVENRVSTLPVVDGRDRCVGMLSSSDLIDWTHELDDQLKNVGRASGDLRSWLMERIEAHNEDERVSEVMSRDVATVSPEATVDVVAQLMIRHRVHRLPVIDNQNCLVGIVSTMDVLAAIADHAPRHGQPHSDRE